VVYHFPTPNLKKKNCNDVISQTRIVRFGWNLVGRRRMTCRCKELKVFCWCRQAKFYRSANSTFGKVGRIASEEVTLQLILSKCIPVILYGLESCPLTKSQLASLNFDRFFMKLFRTIDRLSRLSVNVVVSLGFSFPVFCCPAVLRISCVKSRKLTTTPCLKKPDPYDFLP